MSTSKYEIIAQFKGSAAILAQFRHIQAEARRTSRTMIEGSRAEQRAATEARRREAQATREADRAVREAHRAQQRMFRERERLRREDLAAQRRYLHSIEKERNDIEKKRRENLGRAGVGIAGLGVTAGGIKVAADFESSMTELRLAIARAKDGAVDMGMLNAQMADLEKLAVKLGNTLPGTTGDFVNLFVALKQGGMATEDILGGAGEAIAELAVLTHSEPAALGKQFAQMGQMFKLKPEEYGAAVEQFHALYRMGVDPTELIESSKFFAPRAGAPLGMTGIEGMTQAGTLLGLLNRSGLGGGIGGRDVSTMMQHMTMSTKAQQKMMAELKGKGIDLQFFDKKGKFMGLENMVIQLEKLKKLSPEDQLDATKALFTETGATAAGNLIQVGVEGLRKYVEEQGQIISRQEAINRLQQDFNQQWEALKGTGVNVLVRLFTPAMTALKPLLTATNELLGYLEGLAKTNPGLARFLTTFVGLGSVAMIAKGGIGALTASTQIWRMTAKLAALENATLATTTATVGTAATVAGNKVKWYDKQIKGVGGMVLTTFAIAGLWELFRYVKGLWDDAQAAWAEARASASQGKRSTERLLSEPKVSVAKTRDIFEAQMPGQMANFLKSFRESYETEYDWIFQSSVGKHLKDYAPELDLPSQFALFMQQIPRSSSLSAYEKKMTTEEAQKAFPQAFAAYSKALEEAGGDVNRAVDALIAADKKEAEAKAKAAGALDGVATSATSAADELKKIKAPGGAPVIPEVEQRASGGRVLRSGLVGVHRGEDIVPAHVTRQYNVERASSSAVNISMPINVDARGSTADPAAIRAAVLSAGDELKQAIIRMIDQEYKDRGLSI